MRHIRAAPSRKRGELGIGGGASGGDEEGIGLAFFADRGGEAMTGMHNRVIRQLHQFAAQRIHDLLHRAAPEISATDAAGEKRVASEKLGIGEREIHADIREIQTHAATLPGVCPGV